MKQVAAAPRGPAGPGASRFLVAAGLALFPGTACEPAMPTDPQEGHTVSDESAAPRHTNRLAAETSPYLLQHAHNPVDWYPWGEEAFARAREENKPVFLSIGYSACHWCHVMERECFENEKIAALMNKLFVCIKVDREERPDVDEIYMRAVQALTGSGGWPLSAWLTPEGEPFHGGTYFPPEDRFNRPGFPRVCEEMARVWSEQNDRVKEQAERLSEHVRQVLQPPPGPSGELTADLLEGAARRIVGSFDPTHGGFGSAPKFPHSMDLNLLLRLQARNRNESQLHVVQFTLEKMAAGGMYDQLGGGFHRYSTDEHWLIPHFEKMLYDNALLGRTYLDAWLLTGDPEHLRIVREILDWVLREMTSPEGCFYSTQDADSEGVEGKFFAWTPAQLKEVLGQEDGALARDYYGVTESGNFEHGTSALHRPSTVAEFAHEHEIDEARLRERLESIRARLFTAREQRVHPGRDDKILVDWSGMMITTMARAGFHLEEPRYLQAAEKAVQFLHEKLWKDGRLVRTYKDGKAHLDANLGDYAMLCEGLLHLYQATFDPAHLRWARELVQVTLDHYADDEKGGFFFTADDAEKLLTRSKEAYDGATPSASSVQVGNLLRLSELLGEEELRERALRTLGLYYTALKQAPQSVSEMLTNLAFLLSEPREVVLAADSLEQAEPLLAVLRRRATADWVVLVRTSACAKALEAVSPLVAGKEPVGGKATAYVCQGFTCQAPVHTPEELAAQLSP